LRDLGPDFLVAFPVRGNQRGIVFQVESEAESAAAQDALAVNTFESDWDPPLGKPLLDLLASQQEKGRLDLGCVAAHGVFMCDADGCHVATPLTKAATAFLFELIARLQTCATVPMIDVRAYAKWFAT
jgi:hypothetical protein